MVTNQSKKGDFSESPFLLGTSQIPLDLIVEDSLQPRKSFDQESLEELTQTIQLRGVKTPISVRPNPDKPGTYIINHGARRFRASKKAGLKTIPAYIDSDYSADDQVIENVQRDNLTAREISDYIGRQIASGHKLNVIAKNIGKSKAYVSMYVSLLDLPEPLLDAYNSGRCIDITAIYNLHKLFKKHPVDVLRWLECLDKHEISRSDIQGLELFIKSKKIDKELVLDLLQDSFLQENKSNETEEPTKKINKKPVDQLLTYIYVRLKKKTHKPDDLIQKLSIKENKLITDHLKKYFLAGKQCKNVLRFTLKSLRNGVFDGTGRGAFNLIAFHFGVNNKEFSLDKIINEVNSELEK